MNKVYLAVKSTSSEEDQDPFGPFSRAYMRKKIFDPNSLKTPLTGASRMTKNPRHLLLPTRSQKPKKEIEKNSPPSPGGFLTAFPFPHQSRRPCTSVPRPFFIFQRPRCKANSGSRSLIRSATFVGASGPRLPFLALLAGWVVVGGRDVDLRRWELDI